MGKYSKIRQKWVILQKVLEKFNKKGLTILDNCDKILNCIIIAYYAHFYPLHIGYMGKNANKCRVEIEFVSFLFIYAYV